MQYTVKYTKTVITDWSSFSLVTSVSHSDVPLKGKTKQQLDELIKRLVDWPPNYNQAADLFAGKEITINKLN